VIFVFYFFVLFNYSINKAVKCFVYVIYNSRPNIIAEPLFHSLGIDINNDFDFKKTACEKFKKVQKSIFSLSYLGLTPNGVSPFLKSFLYKTYCLSQFTYGLETSTLNVKTRDYLNIAQNNLIRQIIGLEKYCHMTEILKIIQIFKFDELYISTKLSILESLKNNEMAMYIFNILCRDLNSIPNSSHSFQKDIILLQTYFGIDIEVILTRPVGLKPILREAFRETDGLVDSISYCLHYINNKHYRNLLNFLIKPHFLLDFQEQMRTIIS